MRDGRGGLWALMAGFALGSLAWAVCQPFLPLRIIEIGVTELGEVARQVGLLLGLSSLLNAGLGPAWSWVGARTGYRLQVLRAHLGTALGWGLFGLAPSTLHMGGAALVLGGLSGTYPHYVALAAMRAAPSEVGRAVGDLQAASQIGNAFGPLVGGLIASQFGVQSTFFVSTVLSLTAIGLILAFVPADSGRAAQTSESEGMGAAWRRPQQRWLMALVLVGDTGIIGLRPLVPIVLAARIPDPAALAAATGVATTLVTAGAIVAAIGVGRISRRIEPSRILLVALPLAVVCVLLVPFAPNVPTLVALWTLAGLAGGATTPVAFAWLGRVAPRSAGGYALLASASMATYALGPFLMGQVSPFGLTLPFFLAAALAAIATLIALTRRSMPAAA